MVKFPAGVHIKIEVGVDGNKKNTGGLKRTAVPIGTKAIKKEDDAPDMKKQKISIHVECTTADVADVAPRKPFWRRPFKGARPGQNSVQSSSRPTLSDKRMSSIVSDKKIKKTFWNPRSDG